ncbi:inositol monophosphatase family protein [Pannus brasiliensis CCIBt3594]|uniref:Inositol monophosphatase family protein n=1 Tax=Pannus brasiliensis CCIBt3594 TaxID=1427578 RepID=A0AAW9QJX5_9CHRO
MDLDRNLQLAHELADTSAEAIRRYFRQPRLSTETKIGEVSSIVTIADRVAEEAMVDIIRRKSPEDGIIREEGENIPSRNGRYWVLDPIDGTSSFARGLPIFGTLIGLVEDDRPVLGVVDQPILGDRWWAVSGGPGYYNGKAIDNPHARDSDSELENACLVSTTPLMFVTERQRSIAAHLQHLCRRTAFGGDCYNYMMLATGTSAMPLIVLESDMKFYDFCALIPIIEGSGAIITDWSGNPLVSTSTEVLASSNRGLHDRVIRAIGSVK